MNQSNAIEAINEDNKPDKPEKISYLTIFVRVVSFIIFIGITLFLHKYCLYNNNINSVTVTYGCVLGLISLGCSILPIKTVFELLAKLAGK